MASYLKKEISEWNTNDLCNWLLANKFRGISEFCQKYSLSGYDLFFINDDILKNELNLKSFHERKVALKLFKKLTYEHLKLNVINSNGDNVILTLDNDKDTKLGEISDYIGNMFNINPKDILYKDSTKQEVLSPTVKIVPLLILYPKIYKTLNVSNMKDYHQNDEELMDSGSQDFQDNNIEKNEKNRDFDMGIGSMGSDTGVSGDMGTQEMNMNKNNKMRNNNYNYRENKNRKNDSKNRRDINENVNYKYNNNYAKVNNNIINKNNNNRNLNEDFMLSGSGDNNNPMTINNNNMNSHNNKDYQDNFINNNLGKQFKNEERMYREREKNERQNQDFQYSNEPKQMMMDYNEESNLGLLSSGNDDEMKFKPSYEINMENNDRDYNNKKNYHNQ